MAGKRKQITRPGADKSEGFARTAYLGLLRHTLKFFFINFLDPGTYSIGSGSVFNRICRYGCSKPLNMSQKTAGDV